MRSITIILFILFSVFTVHSQSDLLIVYNKKINPNFDYKSINNNSLGYFKRISKNISKFKYNLEIDLESQTSKFSANYQMSTDGQTRIDRQVLNILNSRYPVFTNIKKDSIFELSNHPALGSKIFTRFPLNSYKWVLIDSIKIINGYKCKLAEGTFIDNNFLINSTKEYKYFAWYTTDLPNQYGPSFFTGLPGLVLIAGDDKFIFEADKIEQKNIKFSFPKLKSITEEELTIKMKSVMQKP